MTSMEFQSLRGEFVSHSIKSEGVFPRRVFIVEFIYENGRSTFDGRDWTYELNNPATL